MRRVHQTITEKGKGNCVRATIASLMNKSIDEVPEFPVDDKQSIAVMDYFFKEGYEPTWIYKSQYNTMEMIAIARLDKGLGGYFYATVKSKTFENTLHAVVVDTNLNVVHDPHPSQQHAELKSEDIIDFITVTDWEFPRLILTQPYGSI